MRKLLLLFLTIGMCVSSFNLAAQYGRDSEGIRYRNLFGAGLSMGYYNYGYKGSRSISFPPVTSYIEFGVHKNITVGPYIGFARWNYRYTGFAQPYNYSWAFTSLGARGSLHLSGFINESFGADIDESRTDFYLTVILGMEYRRYSTETADLDDNYSNSIHLLFGPLAGVRYYFSEYFAVYFEAGRGSLGVLSFGLSLKL